MTIIHNLDDFIFQIFPDSKDIRNNPNELKKYFEEYYSYGSHKPTVKIDDGVVFIEIDTDKLELQQSDFRKAVSLCEKRRYSEAKIILDKLIESNPSNSEYHRIYGQILSDEGNQEEAIHSLIDALRWDPANSYALLMMGNIFGKFKNDFDTSMKYYEQALKSNPEDNITLNNIGATLLQQDKIEEAKKFFLQAAKINSEYPNTHYALSVIAIKENQLHVAFDEAILALKHCAKNEEIYGNSLDQAAFAARDIFLTGKIKSTIEKYLLKLEDEGGVDVEINSDENIETAAKIEFAENHNRDKHRLLYKPGYNAVEHLQMHELVHLDLAIEARKHGSNKLFISTQQNKGQFIRGLEHSIKRLKKDGFEEKLIANYCSALFSGINRQIFNTPIDLYIEDFLYNSFPELRPYQFISLNNLIREGAKAVTDKKIVELSPKEVLSKSKIYNLISALQFNDLYGVDLIPNFKANNSELKTAQKLYTGYQEVKDNRKPGGEYDLVQKWADQLKFGNNFELVSESEYRKRSDPNIMLDSISEDPFGLKSEDPEKIKETEKFLKSQQSIGVNMAVVIYMAEALRYFEKMDKVSIRDTAFEIALLGAHGIHPEKNYKLNSISGKEFTGYKILSYYYVSWKLVIPEKLPELKLPYDNEYELAEKLFKNDA